MGSRGAVSDDWVERRGGWSTDEAARLYGAHRLWLVRLGVLLVDDLPTAEEVVQDAFAGFLSRTRALRDPDEALAYLRTSVVNRSRSALRRRRTAREYVAAHDVRPGRPSDQAILDGEHREILDAVAQVPNRQREVLVLRCWSDLSETQIAETLRITSGTVQSSFHRAREAVEKMLPGTVTSGLTEDRLRDALRLIVFERERLRRRHRAKAARARAAFARDHERRRPLAPALPTIRALRLFAHGVQPQVGDQRLCGKENGVRRQPHFDPVRLRGRRVES